MGKFMPSFDGMSASPNYIVVVSVPDSKASVTKMLRYRLENKTCLQGIKAKFMYPPIGSKIHIVTIRCLSSELDQSKATMRMHLLQEYLDSFVEEVSKFKKRPQSK
jgi:hypothetical protein